VAPALEIIPVGRPTSPCSGRTAGGALQGLALGVIKKHLFFEATKEIDHEQQ
jgi:hypothetical protein